MYTYVLLINMRYQVKSHRVGKKQLIRLTTSAGNCGSLSFPLKTPVLVRTDDHGWPACKVQIA